MKKISSIILSICSLILISGCMKYNVTMEINKDKSMNLEIIYAMNQEMIEDMMEETMSTENEIEEVEETTDEIDTVYDDSETSNDYDYSNDYSEDGYDVDFSESIDSTDDSKEALEKRGYKVKEYEEDGYTGIKATLEIENIDNVSVEEDIEVVLSNILEDDFSDDEFFTVKKGLFKNTYTANFVYEVEESETDSSYASAMSGMDFKYTVILPSKSISNNADSEKDNKLSWDISLSEDTKIEYSFEMPNTRNIIIASILGIGLVLLIIIIIIVIVVSSIKKKKNNNTKQAGIVNTSNNVNTTQIDTTVKTNTTTAEQQNKCRYCKSDITQEQTFCINCGNKLK